MLLDPDMMGFGSAAFFGTLAMALGFWRQLDGFTVAVRVGLTALVAYAATFLCARYLRGVGDRLAREEQRRLEEERRARAAEAAREKGEEA
ncbi:MAG TPA: hypothetical protein PKO36_18500 [Candidatus Hydrogenedentes bacterium]|nr:hypothetical protein [Candidatus Hydrogenedentota bacterium]HOV73603.1 hypothetical protein [Candidatus Hydrogenedentota bacterium]